MIKTNLIINFYPILLNLLIILIISSPTKYNKFNPITIIFLLIILTSLISIKLNILINSWRSFIIFLIIIGGLIIIFLYITRLRRNELFIINFKLIILNIIKLLPLIIILLFFFNLINFNRRFSWYGALIWNFNLNFYELYSNFYCKIILFSINYLFYSIICIINICYKNKSPIRQLNFN